MTVSPRIKSFTYFCTGIILGFFLGICPIGKKYGQQGCYVYYRPAANLPTSTYVAIDEQANLKLLSLLGMKTYDVFIGDMCTVAPANGGYDVIFWTGHPLRRFSPQIVADILTFIKAQFDDAIHQKELKTQPQAERKQAEKLGPDPHNQQSE